MANTIIGIILMLISTSIMQIGTCLQKGALDKMPKLNEQAVSDNVKGLVKNKIWILGWMMTTGAIVLQAAALGQADMTVIQPLIAWGLIVLVVFSHYYLGENVRKKEIIGIVIAIIGVIILGVTAGQSREFSNVQEVYDNYTQTGTWILIPSFLLVIFIAWAISVKTKYKDAGVLFAFCAATFSILGLTLSKGLFSILDLKKLRGTLTMWESWVFLGAWVSQSTMAIIFQQMSLQRGKSIIVTPVFNLASMILPLITGAVIFGEEITTWKIVSTIIIIVGAAFLSFPSKKQIARAEDSEDQPQVSGGLTAEERKISKETVPSGVETSAKLEDMEK